MGLNPMKSKVVGYMRIGKWPENKIHFRDTTSGRRGIQWSPDAADAFYRLCWFGRVAIPARGTATNYGGTAAFQKTRGGQREANVWARTTGTYATTAWGHQLDNVVGAFFQVRPGAAAPPPTAVTMSIVDATTVLASVDGFTAYTIFGCLFVWGATVTLY